MMHAKDIYEDIIIRDAKPEDKPFVLEFTEKTWEWGDYIKYVWDKWIRDPNGRLLIAECNGKPVGIMHIQFLPDESAWLEGLRVHPEYRRRGIAWRLNQYAFRYIKSRGVNRVRVAIVEWNTPSLNLARKLGFYILDKWLSFWLRFKDIPECGEAKCKEEVDPEKIWDKISKSAVFLRSNGYIPVAWRWFRVSKKILAELLKNGAIKCITCNEDLIVIYRVEEDGSSIEIPLINMSHYEELFSAIRYLRRIHRLKEEDEIEILFPLNYDPAKDLVNKIPDHEIMIIMEKHLNE